MKRTLTTHAYFDCNATTPVLAAASQAALDAMQTLYGNPSSAHLVGIQAKFILESNRTLAAQAVGAQAEEIIFTSGATEAIQTAIFSALQALKEQGAPASTQLLYCATEHKVIPQALKHWVKMLDLPYSVVELPVDHMGQILIPNLRKALPKSGLLCTMAVNNETGVIQDLDAIEKELLEMSTQPLWLVDCVQGLGKLDLQLSKRRIDYAPFSGHKLYAPKGVGFLYVKKNVPLFPLIVGGGQEKGQRSGTENLPGIAALGPIFQQILGKSESTAFQSATQMNRFRDQLVTTLKQSFPKIEFNTPFEKSVPTTINFSIPGLSSRELMDLFDSAGLRISSGSACNSQSVTPSHVLEAMSIPAWRSTSALRLSFGPLTQQNEIDRGCEIIRECAIALQNTCLLEARGNFEAPENLCDGILQFRAGASNSWLIADRASRNCIIIDPCESNAERMEHYVRCQKLSVLAILDTHSHGDHTSARTILCQVLDYQVSTDILGWPQNRETNRVTLENGTSVPFLYFGPLETPKEKSLILACLATPGHTRDSTALLLGVMKNGKLHQADIQYAFSGDTVLTGGLGRTNFSASQPRELFHSLRAISAVLGPSTLICPGHDYNQSFATHLQVEAAENSLLAFALEGPSTPERQESFLNRKEKIDSELAQLEKTFQGTICGVTTPEKNMPQVSTNESLLTAANNALIIDVREHQEFTLFKDWEKLGLHTPPRNVPLSRFVNFMSELLTSGQQDRNMILICRTGSRSAQAAKSLRRLGFTSVRNLEGGVALAAKTE